VLQIIYFSELININLVKEENSLLSIKYDVLNKEKQIKAGSRQKKIDLINENNPAWIDLYNELQF